MTDIIYVVIAVLLFALQLFLCLKVKNVFVRLLPTLATVITAIVFYILMFVTEGWDVLGYLLLFLFSAMAIAVCALAWLAFLIIWLIRRKKP